MIAHLAGALVVTTAYAVIRYAGFGGVAISHVPVYLVNKSASMSAAVSLLMSSVSVLQGRREAAAFWARACSRLAFIHVLLSLAILSKGYFPKWFDGDKLGVTGEATILLGVMSAYCVWRLSTRSMRPAEWRMTVAAVHVLVAAHLFVMGYDGWLQVQKWNGGLPPITLVSFLVVMYGLMTFLRSKNAHHVSTVPDARRSEPALGQ